MPWLIVGPYPPSQDPAAPITRAAVAARLAAGDEIRVVSPEPSAAHEVESFAGIGGLVRLTARAKRAAGLWVRIGGGGVLTTHPGRARAVIERRLLASALRGPSEAVVDVGDVAMFPGGRAGRFVLQSGARFEVDDADALALLVERGADPARVTVRRSPARGVRPLAADEPAPSATPTLVPSPEPAPVPPDADPDLLQQWIRTRAETVRAASGS